MFNKVLLGVTIFFAIGISLSASDLMAQAMNAAHRGDYKTVKTLSEQACNNNDARGCGVLGGMYLDGQGVSKDSSKAFKWLNKACELKNEYGCDAVGGMYEGGQGTKINLDKARIFYQKACELDSSDGCMRLGFMYSTGKSVQQSFVKSNAYFKKACDLNSDIESGMGCMMIANAYGRDDMGVNHNYNNVLQFGQKACDLGVGLACFNLGDIYADVGNIRKARR